MKTNAALSLKTNGKDIVYVTVLDSLMNKTLGLCGDFDNDPASEYSNDDYFL